MAKKKTAGVRKVGDRQYEIDYSLRVGDKRSHIRASGFSTAKEAEKALPGLIEAKKRSMNAISSNTTFDELVEEYEAARSTQVKEQTLEALHYTIGKHITPSFTGLRISEALTFERVSKWYRSKATSTTDSAERKNKVFFVMRQLVDIAWKRHYISSDAHQDIMSTIENVRLPNCAKEEKAVWTYEQEQKFISAIPEDSIDYPMFSLFCYLGCRISEFVGLQWKCFDDANGVIRIGQQVIQTLNGRVLSGELKTNESYRFNQLNPKVLNILRRYRSTLNESEDDDFIFPSPYNQKEPLSKSEFRRRFYKYIELAGVPKIVPHGVRHSKATMLAGVCHNAEEIAVGAKFLGHSATMFMETYVSKNGVSQDDLIGRLDKAVGS